MKSRVKSWSGVLRAVKCSLIRVPFFVVVQMILIIGMHNFFNMQIKVLKPEKKKKAVWFFSIDCFDINCSIYCHFPISLNAVLTPFLKKIIIRKIDDKHYLIILMSNIHP